MFMNCEKYKVILFRQKQEISQRNADRYTTAVQAAGGNTTQQTHSKSTMVTPSKSRTTSNSKEELVLTLRQEEQGWGVEVMNHLGNLQNLSLIH